MEELLNDRLIYLLAICSGAIITIAYSALCIFSINITGEQYSNFNQSRKVLGTTFLLWSCYLMSHLFLNLRFTNNYAAMSVSLATYFMLIEGFEMTLHTLLDHRYFSWRRVRRAIIICLSYNLLLAINYLIFPHIFKGITIIALSIPLLIELCFAGYRAYKRYKEVRNNIENYYSDDISQNVVWMKNCIFIMLSLGFSTIFIPFGTALTDSITMFIAIGVITYMMVSLNNYISIINSVNLAIHGSTTHLVSKAPIRSASIKSGINKWVAEHKFTTTGVTIENLASEINSNRTYVSDYINNNYKLSFRGWIAKLRIEYSQTIMSEQPKLHIAKIAELVGYSRSSFVAVFTKEVGMTPAKWREEQKI